MITFTKLKNGITMVRYPSAVVCAKDNSISEIYITDEHQKVIQELVATHSHEFPINVPLTIFQVQHLIRKNSGLNEDLPIVKQLGQIKFTGALTA